ncbi:MAG: hypothetical protein B7733_18925 [Myxococcales bacterium FL481]|nr:MAG: hypothetical protein B7733_18925 [Myxococcales bacterium FL481]
MSSIAPFPVHYYIHGRGRGHATRSLTVIERLRAEGFAVRVFAGRDAQTIFSDASRMHVVDSLLPEARLRLAELVPRRLLAAQRWIRRERPVAVISDGDGPAIWAARWCKLPSIAVGHGLTFSHCDPPPGAPIARDDWRREGRKAAVSAAGSSRQVAVNFVAVPPIRPGTVVARPQLRRALVDPSDGRVGSQIVTYFRDEDGGDVLQELTRRGHRVHAFGRVDPKIDGVAFSLASPDAFAQALKSAAAVVSSAGSQLISECVALGIPQLALYAPGDLEQSLNVAMLVHAKLGFGCARGRDLGHVLDAFLPTISGPRRPGRVPTQGLPDVTRAVVDQLLDLVDRFRAARSPLSDA